MDESAMGEALSVRTNPNMNGASRPKLNLPIKLALGLGTSPEIIVLIGLELFVLFYYTQILGLSGALTGSALFIAMCLDGLSDPILGTFSDNLRNAPFGRRHTLMFLAPLPLGLCFALVFMPPHFLHGLGLFAWLTVTVVGCRIASALFIIPNSAQLAEMSRDSEVRASLSIYRSVAQTGFQLAIIWLSFQVFFAPSPHFANGQERTASYPPFGLAWGAVLFAITSISALGTYRFMRAVEASTPMEPVKRMTVARFFGSWKSALAGNPNVRVVFLGALTMVAASAVARTLTSHMAIYFWKLAPSEISNWQLVVTPGMLVGLFCARYLLKFIDMKPLILIAMVAIYVSYTLPPLFKLMHLFPAGASGLVYVTLVVANVIQGLGFGVVSITSGLMCAQTADEEELLLGGPEQGLVFGFIFLAIKLGSGVGKLLSGFALDLIKFPVGKPAAAIGQTAIDQLAYTEIWSIVLLGGLSLVAWGGYTITIRRHAEITAALAQRVVDHAVESAPPEIATRPAVSQGIDFNPAKAAQAL
jgi:Na+/melibiose symporter-like transporter